MKTQQETYLDFLGRPDTKMAIPVFQRMYTWSPWQCEELLDDIVKAGTNDETHFIGSIVFTSEQLDAAHGNCELRNIVDGQQRTTTVTLLFTALRDYLREHGDTCGLSAQDIEDRYLYVTAPNGTRSVKFTAAPADHATYLYLLEGADKPEDYRFSKRIERNYRFFADQFASEGFDFNVLLKGLGQLFAIVVELSGDDNPQLIFEGINSKGMALNTGDLLRNKLFYGNDEAEQERLLATYWEPIEALFEEDEDESNFNAALRMWLVSKDEELEKYTPYELYSGFRKYLNESYEGTTQDLMAELLEHCKKFRRLIDAPMVKKHLNWATGETGFGKGYGVTVGMATQSMYNAAVGATGGRMFP